MILVNAVNNCCKPKQEIYFWADLGRLPRKLGTAWIAWPSHKCLPISWAPLKLTQPFACAPSRPDDDAILRNSTQFYAILRNSTQFYAILDCSNVSCSIMQRHAVSCSANVWTVYNSMPQRSARQLLLLRCSVSWYTVSAASSRVTVMTFECVNFLFLDAERIKHVKNSNLFRMLSSSRFWNSWFANSFGIGDIHVSDLLEAVNLLAACCGSLDSLPCHAAMATVHHMQMCIKFVKYGIQNHPAGLETVLIGVHILSKKGDFTTVPRWFLMLETLQNLRRVFCLFTVITATHAPFTCPPTPPHQQRRIMPRSNNTRDLCSVVTSNVATIPEISAAKQTIMYEVYTRNVDMPPHPTPPQPNLWNCVFQKRAFYEHGFRSTGKIMYNVASVWRQALLWAHHASGAVPCLCSRTVQWPSVWPRTTPTLLSAMICHGIYENANLCIASIWCYMMLYDAIWCYMMLYVSICHIHSYSSCQNYQLFSNNMPNISKYSK